MNVPKVGDIIYVPPTDDSYGGKAIVSEVVKIDRGILKDRCHMIHVEQIPGYSWRWEDWLETKQSRMEDKNLTWAFLDSLEEEFLLRYPLEKLEGEIYRRKELERKYNESKKKR